MSRTEVEEVESDNVEVIFCNFGSLSGLCERRPDLITSSPEGLPREEAKIDVHLILF